MQRSYIVLLIGSSIYLFCIVLKPFIHENLAGSEGTV